MNPATSSSDTSDDRDAFIPGVGGRACRHLIQQIGHEGDDLGRPQFREVERVAERRGDGEVVSGDLAGSGDWCGAEVEIGGIGQETADVTRRHRGSQRFR